MDKHTIAHLKTVMDKEQLIDFLADQLEKVELELIKPLPIGELVHRLEGQTYEKWFSESDVKDLRERAQKAEAALSAATEKLSKPIVLSSSTVMSRACAVRAIKSAGFTVEGE